MSNNYPVVLLAAFAVSLLSVRPAQAQSLRVIPQITQADIVNATALVDPLSEKVKVLPASAFSLSLVNTTASRQTVSAVMHIETFATFDEDRERMQLATADSRPFLIPPEGRLFTSGDIHGADDIDFTVHRNEPAIDRLKDKIQDPVSGGRVPSGTYAVAITITVIQIGTQPANETIVVPIDPVVITNPTVARLLVPSENGYAYPTPFPQFQWISDTRAIMLSVYEKRPGQQSLEDATQASDPWLQVRIDRRASGNASTFTYPQTGTPLPGMEILKGPRPLEPGKTYVAVMEGLRSSIGMEVEPLRTICSFTIDNPQAHAQAQQPRTLFSAPELQRIASQLEDLKLQIDAGSIVVNGTVFTLQQLQVFFDQHKDKPFTFHIEE